MMHTSGSIIALLGLGCLFGGMVFFGTIMTPLVFTKLPPETASLFIRATFPRYYLYVSVAAAIAALGLVLRGNLPFALVLALVLVLTLWLWQDWLPHLNSLRDSGNQTAFARGHRLSVWLNGAQLLAVLAVLVALARGWGKG
ncbi:MAG: DUF4149 domain-containing protein [Acidiphilium sp.]